MRRLQRFTSSLSFAFLTFVSCAPNFEGSWAGDANSDAVCSTPGGTPKSSGGTIPTRWSLTGGDAALGVAGAHCPLTATLKSDGTYSLANTSCPGPASSSNFDEKVTLSQGVLGIAPDGLLRFNYRMVKVTALVPAASDPAPVTCSGTISGGLTRD